MPKICHNAPGLKYRVYWKQNIPGEIWNFNETTDYTINELTILNQTTDNYYKVKIVAFNEKGESNGLQKEVIVYSEENSKFFYMVNWYYFYFNYHYFTVPVDAPQNLTVMNVTGSKSAILSWEPVSPESVKGKFKGYKVNLYIFMYIIIFFFITSYLNIFIY